jgi:uncharacterized cupredoxin-like copper-binding protein
LNLERVRRAGTMAFVASFALVVLAACGEPASQEAELEDVTRVPTMSDAAAQATREAPPPGATPEDAAGTPAAGEATPADGGETAEAISAEVVSHDIFFEPTELTIPANTDVTFVLPNEGVTSHNFSIDALGVDVDQAPGATEEVVINAQAGEYEFYCNVPGHREAGMVGTLIVSEEAAAAPAEAATPAGDAASPAAPAETEATPGAAAQATPETASEPAAAAEPVEVVSYDIYFEPDEVTIPADTDVTFVLPNDGVTPHNFSIDALGVDVDQAPGESQEIVINAPAGEYEYYCNVPGHKEAGMVGTLIVTEDAGAATAPAPAADGTPLPEETTAAVETASPEAAGAESAATAAEPVEVVSHDIYFDPDEITIPANTDVTFILPNKGVTLHNFAIDALGVDVDQAPGETYEVVINAPPGEYEYYCNVPGHREAGMVGTLIVSEGAGVAVAQEPAADGTPMPEEAAAPADQATPATAGSEPAPAAPAATEVEPVEVVSHDIYFEPDEISIPADTDVTFVLPNEGVTPHNFAIDALGIDIDQAPGETQEVVINASAGTYEYYCNVPGHKPAGMVGTLTVE